MTAIGFIVIVAYLLAFFIYNGLYSIKNKIDKQQFFYNETEKVITTILAVIFIIAYFHNWTNYKIDQAYHYIVNHPDEYTDYIAESFVKSRKKLYKCVEDDNCSYINWELNQGKKTQWYKEKSKEEQELLLKEKRAKLHEFCIQKYEEMKIHEKLIDEQINDHYYLLFEHADRYEPRNLNELLVLKAAKIIANEQKK